MEGKKERGKEGKRERFINQGFSFGIERYPTFIWVLIHSYWASA